jgi:hypothetical protein
MLPPVKAQRSRRVVFVPFLLIAAALVMRPTPALAQTATDEAAAEALFKLARDLMAAGKYAEACPKLAESQRLDPGTGTLLNLATCYEKNGQVTSAWATYKEAALAAQNAGEASRVKLARQKAAALEPTLPTLAIVVPPSADRPDLQVTRDGAVVGRAAWGTPIPVDPGVHLVQASAPGRKPWQAQPRVAGAGAALSLEIPPLEPEVAAPASASQATTPAPSTPSGTVNAAPPRRVAETPAPAQPGATQRLVGFVVGGVGLAGLVAGGVAGAIAKSKNDAATSQCNGTVCNAQGITSLDNARGAATASTVGFIAGGALVATGVVLVLLAPHAPAATGWTLIPASDSAVAGLTLRGAF